MKPYLTYTLMCAFVLIVAAGCKKDSYPRPTPNVQRTIHYSLYTNADNSEDNHTITFSVFIRKGNKVLLDSALAPMKIKDIPDAANKIVIEKIVPNNDPSNLSVGFAYSIDGVGHADHVDTCNAGQTFKIVDFAFQ